MKVLASLLIVSAFFLTTWSSPASAQESETWIISTYRIAPGHHVAFLQWMADQEAASRDAGVPVAQWYVHQNGDSWDFLGISPDLTDEQDAAVDAAAVARGLKVGMPAGIELRQHVAEHHDTYAGGPRTASELLAAARGN